MLHQVIADTGVLVALINRRDVYHSWVTEQLRFIAVPLVTCEAVLSETWFLLQRVNNGHNTLLQLLQEGQIKVHFDLGVELDSVVALMKCYQSVPVSLADAELVRMAELYPHRLIFTLDSDFHIYRKNRKDLIPLIIPGG